MCWLCIYSIQISYGTTTACTANSLVHKTLVLECTRIPQNEQITSISSFNMFHESNQVEDDDSNPTCFRVSVISHQAIKTAFALATFSKQSLHCLAIYRVDLIQLLVQVNN